MTTAIAERAPDATALPKDQLDLIRRTVANGATTDELALFLYDCQRRGIHPLDKLLHFTKRGGKYTPVTSIDFMRSQAAATGEMAGSDDVVFHQGWDREGFVGPDKPHPNPSSATVTVYRLTAGQRFAYSATARWAEYCPDNSPMWKRMPHTMLGKCAEALALRKAFPQQLAGLYSGEEMDQADSPIIQAPALPEKREKPSVPNGGVSGEGSQAPTAVSTYPLTTGQQPSVPNGGDSGISDNGPDLGADLPPGAVLIERIDITDTKNPNVKKHLLTTSTGETYSTINTALAERADKCKRGKVPVYVTGRLSKFGNDLDALVPVESWE